LLVFHHTDPGLEAGIQVVAGGVDEGESFEQAAVREVWEEAGLRLENPVYLGSLRRQMPSDFPTKFPIWHQHYFWLEAPLNTPDEWLHTVSDGADDMGMIYKQFFVPLHQHGLTRTLEAFLPQLEERL
jgi:8-oxo-dGTP diphosphatase